MQRLLVVCGPTATGKTDLAIALARRLGGEIVNADSRQVYRDMPIGTAQPSPTQRASAPHHLLAMVDPDEPFTLAEYLDRARATIADIAARGRLPIVAGGTGLYVRALARGFDVPRVAPNPALRAELEALAASGGNAALLERLRRADPAVAATVDPHNARRLIRAIEVSGLRGAPFSTQQEGAPFPAWHGSVPHFDALLLGLTAERAALYERADHRVEAMMVAGFLAEVAALYASGYSPDLPALSSLGYRELGEYLRGQRLLADAVQATKYATHAFIRRQLTWFRREPDLHWLDITKNDCTDKALEMAGRWLRTLGHRSL